MLDQYQHANIDLQLLPDVGQMINFYLGRLRIIIFYISHIEMDCQNQGMCLAITIFGQGGIFIVSHLYSVPDTGHQFYSLFWRTHQSD